MTKTLQKSLLILVSVGICVLGLSATTFASASASKVPDFNDPVFNCGNKVRGTDYRRKDAATNTLRRQVEGAHFTIGVQRGEYGNAGSLEGDLDYVLNKFPNHPQALLVTARNQMKPDYNPRHTYRKDRSWPKKECYFKSALLRAPDDALTHLVIAIFYHEYGNLQVAARHYESSIKLFPGNAETHYNYGLLLIDDDRADEALKHAKQAYAMGYPLEGLKNRLKRQKVWKES